MKVTFVQKKHLKIKVMIKFVYSGHIYLHKMVVQVVSYDLDNHNLQQIQYL